MIPRYVIIMRFRVISQTDLFPEARTHAAHGHAALAGRGGCCALRNGVIWPPARFGGPTLPILTRLDHCHAFQVQ